MQVLSMEKMDNQECQNLFPMGSRAKKSSEQSPKEKEYSWASNKMNNLTQSNEKNK